MRKSFFFTAFTAGRSQVALATGSQLVLGFFCLFIPNLGLAVRAAPHLAHGQLMASDYVVWLAIEPVLLGVFFSVRRWLLVPLGRITQHLQQLREAFSQESPPADGSALNVSRLAIDIGRFVGFALEHRRKHLEAAQALERARETIAHFAHEQQVVLHSTNREIRRQYQSVLAYAHYLDEHISRNKLDPIVRYDFDDTCESSFNLELIAGALGMLRHDESPCDINVPLAPLMQQTMLALAPALDRRAMKLTTAEVDVSVAARGDPQILAHILWMMLLGMIRYAADESTLRLRSLHSRDGTKAMLSIVVSELSPGRLSEEERSDHLERRLQHLTPHMFAETIRIHGNVQLANLLIERLHGSIEVLALTTASCEICMVLPSAEISRQC